MVRAGYATLSEVYSSWSMIDLLEANIVLSETDRAQREADRKAREEAKK